MSVLLPQWYQPQAASRFWIWDLLPCVTPLVDVDKHLPGMCFAETTVGGFTRQSTGYLLSWSFMSCWHHSCKFEGYLHWVAKLRFWTMRKTAQMSLLPAVFGMNVQNRWDFGVESAGSSMPCNWRCRGHRCESAFIQKYEACRCWYNRSHQYCTLVQTKQAWFEMPSTVSVPVCQDFTYDSRLDV